MKKLMIITLLALSCINGYTQTSTKKTTASSNISIHMDNDDYSYRASFEKRFTPEIKHLLTNKLGTPEIFKGKSIWYWDNNVEVILKNGKLTMEGEFASGNKSKRDFIKKLEKQIKAIIN